LAYWATRFPGPQRGARHCGCSKRERDQPASQIAHSAPSQTGPAILAMTAPRDPQSPKLSPDFVAKATSELNNLLQIISGTSSLIEDVGKSGDAQEKYLAMLRSSIERAEKVATELAQQAGGADKKMLMQPEIAPFVKARKNSGSMPTSQSILVVDDERMALTLMERILTEAGFQVVTAQSGFECVDLFRRRPHGFDAVLLDLSLPFMDGEETFTRLRQIRSDIPVVLCTGFIQQETLNRLMVAGLTGFLRKPIAPDEIVGIVRSTLESVKYLGGNWSADDMPAVI
jgi:CheY-like chemotaxis protein